VISANFFSPLARRKPPNAPSRQAQRVVHATLSRCGLRIGRPSPLLNVPVPLRLLNNPERIPFPRSKRGILRRRHSSRLLQGSHPTISRTSQTSSSPLYCCASGRPKRVRKDNVASHDTRATYTSRAAPGSQLTFPVATTPLRGCQPSRARDPHTHWPDLEFFLASGLVRS